MDYVNCPKYNLHFKPAPDGKGTEPLDVYATANGVNINGVEYYSKEKVDELLGALKTELQQAISDGDNAVKSWATSQFQAKA